MLRRPQIPTRTDTPFPYTTLFRSRLAQNDLVATRAPTDLVEATRNPVSQQVAGGRQTPEAIEHIASPFPGGTDSPTLSTCIQKSKRTNGGFRISPDEIPCASLVPGRIGGQIGDFVWSSRLNNFPGVKTHDLTR